MTEKERVLTLARSRGGHGITQIDFLLPEVADGGKPITRLAARVKELRDEGYVFVDGGRRGKCKVYRLLERLPEPAPPEPVLVAAAPRCAIFDIEDAA